MSQRITRGMLNRQVEILNILANTPVDPYTRTSGTLIANAGNYHLSGAYGGWMLCQMSIGGGIRSVSDNGHVSKKELYYQIKTAINFLRFYKQTNTLEVA